MKFSNLLSRIFTRWWLALSLLVFAGICFGYLVPKAQKPIFANCTDASVTKVLDERIMTWTPGDAKQFYSVIGPEGRKAYRQFFLQLDFWFPSLSASLFYISLLSYAFPAGSAFSKLNLLPIIGWLMDVFENINHYTMAGTYPSLSSFSLAAGPVFTFVKWLFVMAMPIIALIGFSLRVLHKTPKH
jgi:hypothetical protein